MDFSKDVLAHAPAASDTKQSVLVVDDEEAVATVLARGLGYAGYEVTVARSGREALERLTTRRFDALLTDIHMPRMRGDEMQRIARERDPDLAVLLITAANDISVAVECLKDGVFDYMTKPFDLPDIVVRVGKALERRRLILENRGHQENLERRVEAQAERLRKTLHGSLESLIQALEAKDPNTRNHSARVADLSTTLSLRLYPEKPDFAAQIRVAALFHDIGKIGVPEVILGKQGPLTDTEMEQVKRHPVIGETILQPLLEPEILAVVRSHHEHYNGKGYPDGLAGEEIPLGGRIVAVADAFDAMTSNRPYRPEITRHRVLEIMRAGADRQWDGHIVNGLLQLAREGYLGEKFQPQTTVEEAAHLAVRIGDAAQENLASKTRKPTMRPAKAAPEKADDGEAALTPATRPRTGGAASTASTASPAASGGGASGSGNPMENGSGSGGSGNSGPSGPGLRPVVFVGGYVDAECIHRLRRQTEELLQRGDRQIVLDMHATQTITPSSAQCIYALDLKAQRIGGRIVLRDVPEAIRAEFQSAGVARMLRFEPSSAPPPSTSPSTPAPPAGTVRSYESNPFAAAVTAPVSAPVISISGTKVRVEADENGSSGGGADENDFSDPGFASEFEEFLRQRRDM